MGAWEMPREIGEAVREHHNPHFRGNFSIYANLVYVANALSKRRGIGDGEMAIPAELLERTGLELQQAELALLNVLKSQDRLEFIANEMAA